MSYSIRDKAGKLLGTLDAKAHPVVISDSSLREVFGLLHAKGITQIKPVENKAKNIWADDVTVTSYADATPQQIISELYHAGFEAVPDATDPK